MLLVLDTRVDASEDHAKQADVTLQEHVWGWMPIEGDCAAGFVNCAKVRANASSAVIEPAGSDDAARMFRAGSEIHVVRTSAYDCVACLSLQMVVGNEVSLQLRPGDAQLVALTVAR
jgi:hypothetical protein